MGELRIHRVPPARTWPPTIQWPASTFSKPDSLSFMTIVTRHRQCQSRRLVCRWTSRDADCQLGRAYLGVAPFPGARYLNQQLVGGADQFRRWVA
jgi:hypothetical protein